MKSPITSRPEFQKEPKVAVMEPDKKAKAEKETPLAKSKRGLLEMLLAHGTAVRGAEDREELVQLHNSESLKKEEEDDLRKLPPAEALRRLIHEVTRTGTNRSANDINELLNYLIGKLSLDEVREFLKEGVLSPVRLLENPNVPEDMVQAELDRAARLPSLIKPYFESPKLGPQALRTALNSRTLSVRDAAVYYLSKVAEIPEMYDAIIRDGDPRLIDTVMMNKKAPWEDKRKWALDPRSSSVVKFQYISDLFDLGKPITPEDESLIEELYKEDSPHARSLRSQTIPLLPKRMVKKLERSLEGLPAWEDLVLSPHFSNEGWRKLSSDPKRLHRVLSEIVSWEDDADYLPKIPSWVIAQNPGSIPSEFMLVFANKDPEALKDLALRSEENAEIVLERMQQWKPSDWKRHRDVIASIRRAYPYLKNVGEVSKILTDPSSYSPDSVSVRYRTAPLRRFREAIVAAGGQAKKRDLEKLIGRQWPKALNPLLGPKGEITAESIDRYIESLPSTKYLVSHGVWSGIQRHSDEDSKVFRLNITNDHIARLKEAGVFDVFKEFVRESSESHPYDPHTIGWIRWTGEPGKGIFIDEVQSDFTRHPADQAKAQALRRNPNIRPETLEATVKEIENKYPRDKWDTMINILFGGQDPTETLYEAFWQWNRDKGFTGTPIAVHTPSSKAVKALSAQYKEVPAHFRNTYEKIPKRFGMQQRQYGEGFSEEGEDLKGKPVFHDLLRSEEALEVKPDCSHDGVYRIYYHYDHEKYGPQRRLHSRFVIHNGVIHHLEDHFGHLDSMMPEGNLDNRHKRQLARLLTSRYFELINEDDIMAGEYEDEIPEFDPGLTLSDAQFWMISKDGGEPQKVEVQGDVVTIDGIKLTDEEAEKLIFCIQNGLVQLKEIAPQTSLQKNDEVNIDEIGKLPHGTAVRGAEDREELGQLHNSESLKKEEEEDLLKLPPAEALNRLIDEATRTGSNRNPNDIRELSNYLIGKLSLDEVREFLKEGVLSPVRLLENPNVPEDMVQAELDRAVQTPSLIKQYFKSPKLGPQALRTALDSGIPGVEDQAFIYLLRVAEIPEMYNAIIRDGDPRLIDIVMRNEQIPLEDRRKWALDPRSSSATKSLYISDLLESYKRITPEDESLIEKMYKEDSPHAQSLRKWTIPLLPKGMVKRFERSLEGSPAWEDLVLSPHFSNEGWRKLSSDPKRLHRVLSKIVSWEDYNDDADRLPKIPSWVMAQNPGSIPREFIFTTNDPEALKALALHSEENAETVLERMQQWEPSDWERYRDVIASIRRTHPYLKNVGQVSKILTDPSSYSPDSVSVRYRTAALRRFREAIAAAGGQAKKRDLEQRMGRQWPKALNSLLGPKGEITAESIDRYIESMPSTKYLVSHGVWTGPQRHSTDYSKVFRLNITNDHIARLKEAGVFDLFQEFVDKASLSHPYDPHTIGWIRWTGEPGKGIFIDEVQSDFTRHPADQAKAYALRNNPNISPEKLEETVKGIENKYPRDKWDTMINILFGGQDPTETLYEAFWQWNRDKGFTGTPIAVHTPSSKAVKALNAPHEEVPAHFRNTYDKIPKRFGMQQRQYGEGFSEEGEDLKGKPVFHDLLRSERDETKQPQVFYHGTAADFDEFDLSYAGSNTKTPGANRAIFFAANPDAASYYAQLSYDKLKQKWEEEKAMAEYLNKPFDKPPPKIRTIAAHLDIRNPLILGYEHDSNVDPDVYYELMDDDEKALKYAWFNGYDAVVWPYGNMTNEGHTVAVFSPEQIRQVDKDFKAKSQK